MHSSFYVVQGIEYGIMGTDIFSTLEVQIHVAHNKLFLKGEEVTTFQPVKSEPRRSEVRLLSFGRVYSPSRILVEPGQEITIWGNVHSNVASERTGILEGMDELSERSGLLGCATCAAGGRDKRVPVRVMNVTTGPVVVYKGQSLAEFTEATILDEKEQTPSGKGILVPTIQWLKQVSVNH